MGTWPRRRIPALAVATAVVRALVGVRDRPRERARREGGKDKRPIRIGAAGGGR
jgi:hypothetical protein